MAGGLGSSNGMVAASNAYANAAKPYHEDYSETQGKKKMSLTQRLKRAIYNWSSKDYERKVEEVCVSPSNYHSDHINIRASTPLSFSVHSGNGGKVIMTNVFDRQTRDWVQTMYIIHDDDDLTEELAKIISLESMR